MPSSDMDVDRPKSREESVLTENTDDFIIGDRVWVNGTKPGYIQYLGDTRFGPGEWAGVVLDDHSGKNDGSVAGVKYFQCEPKRGVFARLHKLTRYPLLHLMPPSAKEGVCLSHPAPVQRCLTPTRALTPTRTPSPGASRALREGDRVSVTSPTGPTKTGVLRFLGQTAFATGEWAGVELDDPLGKNDGTVAGKRYFRCLPNFGLFAPSHKVARITSSLDRHRRNHHSGGSDAASTKSTNGHMAAAHNSQTTIGERGHLQQALEASETSRKELSTKLEEERRKVEELEFRIEEESIGKDDIQAEREKEKIRIEDLERRLEQEQRKNEMISNGATPDGVLKEETKRLNEETQSLREKLRESEAKFKKLQTEKAAKPETPSKNDELRRREETLLQTQLTLDNKKREAQNLLDRMAELEKELEKSKTRQTRQLDIIDDLNMKIQKLETKQASLEEELHSAKEKLEESETRLRSSKEQVQQLENEKRRLEEKLVSPDSPTPKEHDLLQTLRDREAEALKWKTAAEAAQKETEQLKSERERNRREHERKMAALKEEQHEESRKEKRKAEEHEERGSGRIKELERTVCRLQEEAESTRREAQARLARQEARLQEAEHRTDSLERLKEQVGRLQAEKDIVRMERDDTKKRLQASEATRQRWESDAHRASNEVDVLRSQVKHLRTEFTAYRDDLMDKLKETEFDSKVVQDLHLQIEEQRRLVEEMQHRLKFTEGERDQLQNTLSDRHRNQVQMENGLRSEMDNLRQRLSELESENRKLKMNLDSSQKFLVDCKEKHGIRSKLEMEDGEKINLERKIVDLQVELAAVRNGHDEPDSNVADLKKEKDALDQQVHFLNSVIVDMQHKNDDLRSRLDILETEVIFDGHLQLGLPSLRPTSRLFCDICNSFDLHDTEDCPKQRSYRRTFSHSSQESEF